VGEAEAGMEAPIELNHDICDLLWQTRRRRLLLRGIGSGKAAR
jgi:hypothetical protein